MIFIEASIGPSIPKCVSVYIASLRWDTIGRYNRKLKPALHSFEQRQIMDAVPCTSTLHEVSGKSGDWRWSSLRVLRWVTS